MKLHSICCIIGMMLLGLTVSPVMTKQVSAQIIDGSIAREQLKRSVRKMLYQEKFDDLEKMAQDLRNSKAKFPEGVWKLIYFYEGIEEPLEKTPDNWERFIAKFDKWLQKNPNSVTARVAAGQAWVNYGADARGAGYASSVSEEGWRLFKERLGKAYALLAKKPARPEEDCPGRYHMLLVIANAQGWSRPQYEALFHEAIKFEPAYHPYYLNKADYLRSQWHGEEGEWQRFAQEAVTLTPKNEGKSFYMRILWSFHWYGIFKSFDEPGISWPMMKQSFIDTEKIFPNSPWNLNHFCKFACIAGDKETAKELFERIGERPYIEAWGGKDDYNKWREWAGMTVKLDENGQKPSYDASSEDYGQTLQLAENGDVEAQYTIGTLYEVAKAYVKAIYWYQKAADQGHAGAQHKIGVFYAAGRMPDVGLFSAAAYKEAMRWYLLAAMQGNFNAASSLGSMYHYGSIGVTQDFAKAYVWYSQLELKKNSFKEEISAKLTPVELQQAEQEAIKLREIIQSNKIAAEIEPLNPRNIQIPPEFLVAKPNGNLLEGVKWLSSGDARTDANTMTIKNGGQLATRLITSPMSNGCVLLGAKLRHSRPEATVAGTPFFRGLLQLSGRVVRPIDGGALVAPESKEKTGSWWQVYPVPERFDTILIMVGATGVTDDEKKGSSTEFYDARVMVFPTCDEAKVAGENLYK